MRPHLLSIDTRRPWLGDAWIYTSGAATDELVRLLAELGFSPCRVSPGGERRSSRAGGAARRPPKLAVIAAGREDPPPRALCAELRRLDELLEVPLLISLEPEHLRFASDLADLGELLVRPYSVDELRVRIARARKSGTADDTVSDSDDVVRVGTLALNVVTYEVTIGGVVSSFTRIEFELLKFLMTHPRRTFSREALLTRVWGYAHYGSGRTVDVHIRRLRAKLGPEHAARIRTVRGVGYLFDASEQTATMREWRALPAPISTRSS